MLVNVQDVQQITALIYALVSLACLLIPSLISAIVFIAKAIKNKNWDKLKAAANAAMKEVETYYKTHPNMTSDEKLDMALSIRQKSLATRGITFSDADKKKVAEYINQTIEWFNGRK